MEVHVQKEFIQHGIAAGEGQHILQHRERKGKTSHGEAHKSVCILTLENTLQKLVWREKLRWRREAVETKQEGVWIGGGGFRCAV